MIEKNKVRENFFKKHKSFGLNKIDNKTKPRASKRLKHNSKEIGLKMIKRLSARPYYLIGLLMRFKIYKYSTQIRTACFFIPFIILLLLDNFVLALIISCFDVFFCALFFTFANVERKVATIKGQFEYAEYKRIRAKKDTIAIIASLLFMVCSIVISHFFAGSYLNNLLGV